MTWLLALRNNRLITFSMTTFSTFPFSANAIKMCIIMIARFFPINWRKGKTGKVFGPKMQISKASWPFPQPCVFVAPKCCYSSRFLVRQIWCKRQRRRVLMLSRSLTAGKAQVKILGCFCDRHCQKLWISVQNAA